MRSRTARRSAHSPGRSCGMRSRTRRLFSSASVKSSVNQPCVSVPSMLRRVRRAAKRGCCGDIGGGGDLVLVARHQHAVARHDQVRLDEVRTHLQREEVGGEGVLGDVAAGAAMGDDDGQAAHGADTSTPPPVLLDFCACCSRNATSTTSAKAATSGPTRSSARMRCAGRHALCGVGAERHGGPCHRRLQPLAPRRARPARRARIPPASGRASCRASRAARSTSTRSLARDGTSEEKSDPYAFYAEAPPRTASVVWDLEYPWQDGPWCAQRARAQRPERPLVDLRAAPGLLAAHTRGRQPLPELPGDGAGARRLRLRARLHARRAACR